MAGKGKSLGIVQTVMGGAHAAARAEAIVSQATVLAAGHGGPWRAAWLRTEAAPRQEGDNMAEPVQVLEAGSAGAVLETAAGLSMSGLRATALLGGEQTASLAGMLEEMAGRMLPVVAHLLCRAEGGRPATLQAGHDGLHALAASGAVQLFARNPQAAADLALIARRIAEMALLPVVVAQDARETSHAAEGVILPTAGQARAFLGAPHDYIAPPTGAQGLLHGPARRRVPEPFSVDAPALSGAPLGVEAHGPAMAARRPYLAAPLPALVAQAMAEFAELTGRTHAPLETYRTDRADYLLVCVGSVAGSAMALADVARTRMKLRVGVVHITLPVPLPEAELAVLLRGRKGVAVLERVERPMQADLPLMATLRGIVQRCVENAQTGRGNPPWPEYPAYAKPGDAPPLYSVAHGLGGYPADAGDLLGAVQNMLPHGAGERRVVCAVPFRALPRSPRHEITLQALADIAPEAHRLGLRGSEAPELLPAGTLRVALLAQAGTGEAAPWADTLHPGQLLAALAGASGKPLHVRSMPWLDGPWPSGDCATGAPPDGVHALSLVAAPEPVWATTPLPWLDVLVLADVTLLERPGLLDTLRDGGTLLFRAAAPTPLSPDAGLTPAMAWAMLPASARRAIVQRRLVPCHVGAELPPGATPTAELTGALLALPDALRLVGMEGKALARGLRNILAGHAADPALEALLLGAEGAQPIPHRNLGAVAEPAVPAHPPLPDALKEESAHPVPLLDRQRFWAEEGAARSGPLAEDALVHPEVLAEPFVASGLLPVGTAGLAPLAAPRTRRPRWLPERCTGCGQCWLLCPEAALPAQVNTPGELLGALVARVTARQGTPRHLGRAVRALEGAWRAAIQARGPLEGTAGLLEQCVAAHLAASKAEGEERTALEAELSALVDAWSEFPTARVSEWFDGPEGEKAGSGGLLSLTMHPGRCTGCMVCGAVCPEDAIVGVPANRMATVGQDGADGGDATARDGAHWALYRALPGTAGRFTMAAAGQAPAGLAARLLDRDAFATRQGSAGAGAGGDTANTVLHLFTAMAQSAMAPRVESFVETLAGLVEELRQHVQSALAPQVGDGAALTQALRGGEGNLRGNGDAGQEHGGGDLTLAALAERLNPEGTPVDRQWLGRVSRVLTGLNRLLRLYGVEEPTPAEATPAAGGEAPIVGRRARMGLVRVAPAGGTGSSALPRHPWNPYPFPTALWEGGGAALGWGLGMGHLRRMADAFKLVRMARLELAGQYNPAVHDAFFARFGWRDFSEEEWQLCPPLVLGAESGGVASPELLALLRTGQPVKVLCLDRAGLDALAGQAPVMTPGAPASLARGAEAPMETPGAAELVLALMLEKGLPGGGVFVAQQAPGDVQALLEAFEAGLAQPRPALFNVFLPPGDVGALLGSAALAEQSRLFPRLRFDPALGDVHQCLALGGNPEPGADWVDHATVWLDGEGRRREEDGPHTPAHYLAGLPGLAAHFRRAGVDDPQDALTPLEDYLEMDAEERAGALPCITVADIPQGQARLVVSDAMVALCGRALGRWRTLRALARADITAPDTEAIAAQARQEMVDTVARSLMELARDGNGSASLPDALLRGLKGMAGLDEEGANA